MELGVPNEVQAKKSSKDTHHLSSQVVTFKLDSEEYGIDIMKVQEIILMGAITQIPEVPDYICGVINLRGNVIPIVSLRKRFHLPDLEPTEETRIVVVNVQQKTIGIVVDAVNAVLRMSSQLIENAPPSISGVGSNYIKGLVKLEQRLLILLDIDRILVSDEGNEILEETQH